MNSQEVIKHFLEKRGYSTRKLSAEMGRTSTYVWNSLTNNKSITVDKLIEIGGILDFEVFVRDGHTKQFIQLEMKTPENSETE